MKRIGLLMLVVVALAVMISGNALAQTGDISYYFVTYYSNNVSGAPDATLRFINDGYTGGNIAADIYVLDDSQELVACGACWITPDGILSEDVKTELTNNTVTGKVPSRGVIKVIADSTGDPTLPFFVTAGLHGWATHIERATPTSGAYSTTESPVEDGNLTLSEVIELGELCDYAQALGSGQGTIKCTPEDSDF